MRRKGGCARQKPSVRFEGEEAVVQRERRGSLQVATGHLSKNSPPPCSLQQLSLQKSSSRQRLVSCVSRPESPHASPSARRPTLALFPVRAGRRVEEKRPSHAKEPSSFLRTLNINRAFAPGLHKDFLKTLKEPWVGDALVCSGPELFFRTAEFGHKAVRVKSPQRVLQGNSKIPSARKRTAPSAHEPLPATLDRAMLEKLRQRTRENALWAPSRRAVPKRGLTEKIIFIQRWWRTTRAKLRSRQVPRRRIGGKKPPQDPSKALGEIVQNCRRLGREQLCAWNGLFAQLELATAEPLCTRQIQELCRASKKTIEVLRCVAREPSASLLSLSTLSRKAPEKWVLPEEAVLNKHSYQLLCSRVLARFPPRGGEFKALEPSLLAKVTAVVPSTETKVQKIAPDQCQEVNVLTVQLLEEWLHDCCAEFSTEKNVPQPVIIVEEMLHAILNDLCQFIIFIRLEDFRRALTAGETITPKTFLSFERELAGAWSLAIFRQPTVQKISYCMYQGLQEATRELSIARCKTGKATLFAKQKFFLSPGDDSTLFTLLESACNVVLGWTDTLCGYLPEKIEVAHWRDTHYLEKFRAERLKKLERQFLLNAENEWEDFALQSLPVTEEAIDLVFQHVLTDTINFFCFLI